MSDLRFLQLRQRVLDDAVFSGFDREATLVTMKDKGYEKDARTLFNGGATDTVVMETMRQAIGA